MADLLDSVESFLSETGLAASKFGRDAMNDPNFVADLRGGRDYRESTKKKVLRWINDNSTAEAS